MAVRDAKPEGYLREAAPQRLADVAVNQNEAKRAVDLLDDLADEKLTVPEDVLIHLGLARRRPAIVARRWTRSAVCTTTIAEHPGRGRPGRHRALQTADQIPPDLFKLEMTRAERLFSARRWAQSRAGFSQLRATSNDDKELIALRLGRVRLLPRSLPRLEGRAAARFSTSRHANPRRASST
jgi:hypothetical protein